MNLFRKPYKLRRFGEQQVVRGHVSHPYTDMETLLNVQPLSPNEIALLPEGKRNIKHLKAYGDEQLIATDNDKSIVGDRILYYGKWYECSSSVTWDHTMLSHCESQFVEVSSNEVGE